MLGLAVALALFFAPGARAAFGTLPRRTFDPALFRRLLRYGSPNGIQFALDLIAFNLFVVFLGRIGAVELEAANLAFAVNALAFLPLIGLGMTVSILVGQGIGGQQVDLARRAVRSAIFLSFAYNAAIGIGMLAIPDLILSIFVRAGDPSQIPAFTAAIVYMRYITIYLVFDGIYIIFSHAIRGAGDTRFAMLAGLALSWGTLVLPTYIAHRMNASAATLWWLLVGQVMLTGLVFFLRYRTGKWTRMRVIEAGPVFEVDIQADRGL
jgi:MATE family multidrug resistance protein